jgi:integrase
MRGHLVKRSERSWSIVVDVGRDEGGKRRQKWFSVKGTKADAERELRAILTSLEGGAYVAPNKLTVKDYLESWLRDYARPNLRPTTAQGYEMIAHRHLLPALGRLRLQELRPHHVQAMHGRALAEGGRRDGKPGGLSARTVQQHHRILSEALSHAVKKGLLLRNPCEAVDVPRAQPREMKTLGPQDVARFLDTMRASPHYALFFTALYTGLRRSELAGLRWCDVDLDMATLSVQQTLQQLVTGEYVTGQPKSAKSRRLVDLPPSLALVLRQHREEQERYRDMLGTSLKETDLVFSQPDGSPVRPDTLTWTFRRVAERLGLPTARFHDLRHTHATLMLAQNVHPKIVRERLGHSSIAVTLDTYSHVVPGLQKRAAAQFEESLRPALTTKAATTAR